MLRRYKFLVDFFYYFCFEKCVGAKSLFSEKRVRYNKNSYVEIFLIFMSSF